MASFFFTHLYFKKNKSRGFIRTLEITFVRENWREKLFQRIWDDEDDALTEEEGG